jgi:hypothetical protein
MKWKFDYISYILGMLVYIGLGILFNYMGWFK